MSAVSARSVLRRLDQVAMDQLCAEVARLGIENEQLRVQLSWAKDAAESWRQDALGLQEQLCEATGGRPGLTINGELVVVPGGAS